ncbi:MAG: phosphoenolpyruvate synthase, partial [bacterium]|nr:phosphoenolpyruvate synthase [bacterium]
MDYTLPFEKLSRDDADIVGGKGANLGEMTRAGLPIPPGFVVTVAAYSDFLEKTSIKDKIAKILKSIDYADTANLDKSSKKIRELILHQRVPEETARKIIESYIKLSGSLTHIPVAVRSSATAEDSKDASFAGQQESFMDIRGEANVVETVKKCWASLFTARAVFYWHEGNFDHFKVKIAVVVQKMIQADASGIIFTADPVSNDKTKIVIEGILGWGQNIVSGVVTPDHYEVDKKTLEIVLRQISCQEKALLKGKNIILSKKLRESQKLTDSQILELAKLAKKTEAHYLFPQDMEFAVEKKKIYIVQTRPITTMGNENSPSVKTQYGWTQAVKEDTSLFEELKLLLSGQPASPGLGIGPVKIIFSPKEISKIKDGDVLVTIQTNPDFVPAMKKAAAIVTERGGRTSHAAIVARELGIPCVVGAGGATTILKEGITVTVSGREGKVYRGSPRRELMTVRNDRKVEKDKALTLKTATKIYVNLAEPENAVKTAALPVDGVGLLRTEFVMAQIGIHPKKLFAEGKEKILKDALVNGARTICEAFNPRPVVYRTSDFKTNEYRNLRGGELFEPKEGNPFMGFRGASRYLADPAVFMLEMEAIREVREKYGFKNLWLMLPFVRTVRELIEVRSLIHEAGLRRSDTFRLWLMVEIPANVILLPKFIEAGIDGISIGGNDLTMLTLGADRDNETIAR